jgi:hypothetical protein
MELVTGIWSESVMRAVVAMKVVVMVQVAEGARLVQLVVGMKFNVVVVGGAI